MDRDSAQQLRSAIRESGLYSAAQLAAADPAYNAADDARAADQLLSAGVLSQYQFKKIRNGRPLELVFGPFLILDKIGEGGMGKVYKAIHTGTRQVVALKVVRPQLMSNKTVLKRYEREAKAARALDHPNIVSLLDADEVNGRYYIAMEYVDGLDLSRLMRTFGDPPHKGLPQYQEACEYIRQAALGLQHAHDRGLVHRDIKPSNLLVYGARALPNTTGQAHVKVLDMGLVRSILDDEMSRTELTRDGTVVGTPDYMAPEQAKNSSTVDPRADIYSLGCALYFLLKGQPPFPDGSPIDKLLRHQLDPPPDIRTSRTDLPPGLGTIIAKLLRKNPDERYQTAAELAVALEPYCPWGTIELTPNATPSRRAEAEPLVLAAGPDSLVDASGPDGIAPTHPTVIPAPPTVPPPTPAGVPTVRVRVLQPGNGKAPAPRPAAPVPGATAVPRGDAQPSSGSLPGASKEAARQTRPLAKESTGQLAQPVTGAPVRRPANRVKKPTPPKKDKIPLWIALAILGAILVVGVIVAVVLSRKPKDESTAPTQPSGTASRAPTPEPGPGGARVLPPIHTLLPDHTLAALVIRPQAFWKQVAYEPGAGRRVGAYADAFAARVRFDARKFDRLTIAFAGRDGHPVAIGEGAFLTPEWIAGLDSTWKTKIDDANGVKAFRHNAAGPAPRYSLVLGTMAYAIANDRPTLERLSARVNEKRPLQETPETLRTALAASDGTADAPLVTFAAGPTWTLPDDTTLTSHGLRWVKGTVLLKDNVFTYTIVLSGASKSRLSEFWSEFLSTKLPEQFPTFRPFANMLANGKQSEKVTGNETELHITGEIEWTAFHDAMDRVLPVPEKDAK